jgi:hypothetical protein
MIDIKKIIFSKIEKGFNRKLNEDDRYLYLKEDLGFDSIRFIFFFGELVRELDLNVFDFEDFELINITTIDDLVKMFEDKLDSSS